MKFTLDLLVIIKWSPFTRYILHINTTVNGKMNNVIKDNFKKTLNGERNKYQ